MQKYNLSAKRSLGASKIDLNNIKLKFFHILKNNLKDNFLNRIIFILSWGKI